MKHLKKLKAIFMTIVSISEAICYGLYVNQVTVNLTHTDSIVKAIQQTGWHATIIITIALLLLHIVLCFVPDSVLFNKKEVINNLLKSLTEATFHTYKGLDISAVIQVCNHRTKKRIVKYHYNTDTNLKLNETIDISFGDIGTTCINRKHFLLKEYTLKDWNSESEQYREIVPANLRLIIGEPILDDRRNVIAVLEVDIFESTSEAANGSSKPGYLTNRLSVAQLKKDLNETRNLTTFLGAWASSVKVLLEKF